MIVDQSLSFFVPKQNDECLLHSLVRCLSFFNARMCTALLFDAKQPEIHMYGNGPVGPTRDGPNFWPNPCRTQFLKVAGSIPLGGLKKSSSFTVADVPPPSPTTTPLGMPPEAPGQNKIFKEQNF